MSEPPASLDEWGSPSPGQGPRGAQQRSRDGAKQKRPDHLLAVLIGLGIAAIFAFFAYIQIKRDYFGQVFDATIVGKRRYEVRPVRGPTRHRFDIQYVYVAEDGKPYLGSDKGGAKWHEQRWEAYYQAELGQKVHVQAAKVLGTYYTCFFKTSYQPWRKLIGFLVTGSATCLSVSLLFLIDSVQPRRRQRTGDGQELQQRTAPAIETSGEIPRELAQPLPRRVRFKGRDRSLPWCAFFLPLPFGLIGSYLVLLGVWLGMERSIVGCVVMSIAALVWNAFWLFFVFAFVSERWIIRRLYRWGRAVEGSIAKVSQESGKKSDFYLVCQYTHPGLGLRKIKLPAKRWEYVKSNDGRRVTVLCYAYLPWPTQVYEIGNIFRCY